MRSRLAVLSLLTLAFAAISIPLTANASTAPQQVERASVPIEGTVVGLDTAPQFYLTVSAAAAIRITALPEHRLRIEVRALPNPAAIQTSSPTVEAPRSGPTGRPGYDPIARMRRLPMVPLPLRVSSALYRNDRSRFSSGLRAAALVGTLVSKGRLRS